MANPSNIPPFSMPKYLAPFAPDVSIVKPIIQDFKAKGQHALETNNYPLALFFYNEAFKSCDFHPHPDIREEMPKVLCNRALVFYKMQRYKESLRDAMQVIEMYPSWFKGYWRAAQASKELFPIASVDTLSFLLQGLVIVQDVPGSTKEDLVAFLVEIVSILPKAPHLATGTLEEAEIPSNPEIWTMVLQKLARVNCWEGISLLMIGVHGGPSSGFDGASMGCSCKAISVGSLLTSIKETDLRKWGEKLAIELLKCGASYDEIGVRCQKPPVHVGIHVSLETVSVAFLKLILDHYSKNPDMLNATDPTGSSAFHILVHSGKLNTTIGETILRLLLNYHCNPCIKDRFGKFPIDYVKDDDQAYSLLASASNSSSFLKKRIEELKTLGNKAHNNSRHQDAYDHYSEAIKLTQNIQQLQKDAAILYSNRSAVLSMMKKNEEALKDAIMSTDCDETWHKGHWRKGQVLKALGKLSEAYHAFIDGFLKSRVSISQAEVKINFLFEATSLLPSVPKENFGTCCQRLKSVDPEAWHQVMVKLGKVAEWQSIGYLILGPKLARDSNPSGILKSFGSADERFEMVASGVAKKCNTAGVPLGTVFKFLEGKDGVALGDWLEPLLVLILLRGDGDTLGSFAETIMDTPLHAAVKFALLTGKTSIIDEFPDAMYADIPAQELVDGKGDSVFHTMTKLRPSPPQHILQSVAVLMLRKGLSASVKDRLGKLPVDYLSKEYDGSVFDMFLKASRKLSANDVLSLKEEGNRKFMSGDTSSAIELYTSAILAFKASGARLPNNSFSYHDIAVIYSNRAEGYLKLKKFQEALDDAMESVSYDGHWYKAHTRVGKSYKGLGQYEFALRAFVNAFNDMEKTAEEKTRIEILIEVAFVFSRVPKEKYNVRSKIKDLPDDIGHLWAKTAYSLVCKNVWDLATVAIFQHLASNIKKVQEPHLHLAPLCNIPMVKGYIWGMDLIRYFLMCGADRKTISITPGDKYLHAVVRLTLNCGAGEDLRLLNFVIEKYVATWKEQNLQDKFGNTALHTATSERGVDRSRRHRVIVVLLKLNVDPTITNQSGLQAVDLLPQNETDTREVLLMANYKYSGKQNKKDSCQPQRKSDQKKTPQMPTLQGCDQCDMWYKEGTEKVCSDDTSSGYERLTRVITAKHLTARHRELVVKCNNFIVDRLSESLSPEVTKSLTNLSEDHYMSIIRELANRKKWRQLDSVVRKYRAHKGSDKLTNFAKTLDICCLLSDSTLKASEELKLQILANLLKNGASLGNDGGQRALKAAVQEEHYRVVGELFKNGADPANFTLEDGDTPIHAALIIGLEKDKGNLSIFENMLETFDQNPDGHSKLDPEQQDDLGQCLFHVIAKAKYNSTVLRATEILCNRKISSNIYDKTGKLPQDYLTKKNDRRRQFLRMAAAVLPSKPQRFVPQGPKSSSKGSNSNSTTTDDDLQQFQRGSELGDCTEGPRKITEVTKQLSLKEARKKHVEELIRLLPDKPASVFDTDRSLTEDSPWKNHDGTEDDTGSEEKQRIYNSRYEVKDGTDIVADKTENRSNKAVSDVKERIENRSNNAVSDVKENGTNVENMDQSNDTDSQVKKKFDVNGVSEEMENKSSNAVSGVRMCRKNAEKETDLSNNADREVRESQESAITISFSETPLPDVKDEIVENGILSDVGDKSDKSDEDKEDMSHGYEVIYDRKTRLSQEEESKHEDKGEVTVNGEVRVDTDEEAVDEVVKFEDSDDDDDVDQEEEVGEEEINIDAQVFDNLEWEVECTAEVWKTLRDKHILTDIKRRIVRKVQLLASGEWQPHLCKKLRNVPPTLQLYEAKLSKGGRVIWELAVAFSPRCSQTADKRLLSEDGQEVQPVKGGRIYSEIIRVWDIVLKHDNIYRSVQRIIQSHKRGEMCIIQKKLRGIKQDILAAPVTEKRRYPLLYAEDDIEFDEGKLREQQQELQRQKKFFPPASPNETEYHILKFYTFSSALVSHVLQNIEMKVDFPFRVTDLEHAIIHLSSSAPILLLGRSGTGKTTCCLYRLWSQFLSYWTAAQEAGAPLLPRCLQFIHQIEETTEEDEESDENSDDDEAAGCSSSACGEAIDVPDLVCSDTSDEDDDDSIGQQYDHIHQIFITKNAVLCSEVQKNFHELSHACDITRDHAALEEQNLPNRIQDVEELVYPLFLTSRQLLLMLDASIGGPYFFDRKEDGSLKVDIQGWTDADGPLSILPLLDEDSDNDDEEDYAPEESDNDDNDADVHKTKQKHGKSDPRREVSYEIFVEEIWPRIKKEKKVSYHPSLIWTEIMSFIKGSFEALSKPSGILEKEEYMDLGRKRAPNFSGERDKIYKFFVRYEHFKKQNSLFDETDLVHDVYRRLKNLDSQPWVIHQFFVDETQDFTQAELCLLIRLCQNPNQMFLTGDTAQSIMRGISFRFSDLRSLFYHAQQSMQAMGKTSAVAVPRQVYQLTHNYRSHAGILSLASSVLDIMIEFFPESFDRLKKDQGLFQGPQPVLLESCSFSDLAVLLRGNRRKTSHIEFGAHQAILVVNDAAREAIPEELRLGLVLTIYESKGLEFDDVLLYNFFKDSQANKEWRVVTEFLERLYTTQKDARRNSEPQVDSLAQIDEDVLEKSSRPRPLSFDPNQHKVLNSELKHLYTAVTRARVNVWIFDEDMDKRAPMFEYFKARKLVKSMTVSEIDEASLTEAMFAEKSSALDWIKRGEDFMRHALYEVAAKCFGIGGEVDRQKVALAHQQALVASRVKDNPRQMREEFMCAAELYLECGRPGKAAICLQNARERELAAQMFEKLGQYERAADIYRKMKRPLASSRCYELLGQFDQAIQVLYDNEHYDMAIDTLHRYEMKIKDLREAGATIPDVLVRNKPSKEFTEERLSHKSAELYHRLQNQERMLDSLARLPRLEDRVNFLKERNYLVHAARILEENGQVEEASHILLSYGRLDDALICARKTLKESAIAECLLIRCHVIMNKRIQDDSVKDELILDLKEALDHFQSCNDKDGLGETHLHLAHLTGQVEHVKQAWRAFSDSHPFQNEAGQLECVDWLVTFNSLDHFFNCHTAVRGFERLFDVVATLLNPAVAKDKAKAVKICTFYGLTLVGENTYMLHPRQRPRCMEIIQDMFRSKTERKKPVVEVPKVDTNQMIAEHLLKRGQMWMITLRDALMKLRETNLHCELYVLGIECPGNVKKDGTSVDRESSDEEEEEGKRTTEVCKKLHEAHTPHTFLPLINSDVIIAEFERNIQKGVETVGQCCPSTAKELLNFYTEDVDEKGENWRYKSCKLIWEDLFPDSHSLNIHNPKVNYEIVKILRTNHKFIDHMRDYLKERWNDAISGKGRKRLRSDAAKTTEIFLVLEVGIRIFRLDDGKNSLDLNKLMTSFELDVTYEMGAKRDAEKNMKYYSLMGERDRDKNKWMVCSITRRFCDSFYYLVVSNPFEALIKFTKFVVLLAQRGNYEMLPDLNHFLFWMEFYTTLAFFLIAKLQAERSYADGLPDLLFILPANYLNAVHFVEAMFPRSGIPVQEGVHQWKPWKKIEQNAVYQVRERLVRMVNTLCGVRTNLHVIRDLFVYNSGNRIRDFCLAERALVLGMVTVCNLGKAVQPECEEMLMRELGHIELPDDCPRRLALAVHSIRRSKGLFDVAATLKDLLAEREDEHLFICHWNSSPKKEHVVKEPLKTLSIFSKIFLNENTMRAMTAPLEERPRIEEYWDANSEEVGLTMDEKMKLQRGHEAYGEEERRNRAARIVTRVLRKVGFTKKCWNLRARVEETLLDDELKEKQKIFESVQVEITMCGICGVSFEQRLSEILQEEESVPAPVPSPTSPSSNPFARMVDKFTSAVQSVIPGRLSPTAGLATNPVSPTKDDLSSPANAEMDAQYISNPFSTGLDLSKAWGQTMYAQPQTLTPEQRQAKLEEIKRDHTQSQSHMQKNLEYYSFRKIYRQHALNLKEVTNFINAHQLKDAARTAVLYPDVTLDLNRLKESWQFVEMETQRVISQKTWHDSGKIQEALLMMLNSYKNVRPYILEVNKKKKEEEEQQAKLAAMTSSSATKLTQEELEEDMEEVVPVVEEPLHKIRAREFYNSNKRRGGRRGYNKGKQYNQPPNLPPRLRNK